jgi:hypothetical protein
MMARLTIRTRLMLLTCAGLFVLIATNAYLTKKLAENSAGMVTAAELLKSIEEANSAQIAFGELRYWMTDLAVSQLMMAERSATAPEWNGISTSCSRGTRSESRLSAARSRSTRISPARLSRNTPRSAG